MPARVARALDDIPVIDPAALADGYTGEAYSAGVSATGGQAPYTWAVVAGALPSGVTLDASTGALSGTPSATGTATFTVSVTDAASAESTQAFSLAVYAPPSLDTTTLTRATEGVTYRRAPGTAEALAASAGKAPLHLSATGLPAGLALDGDTGELSGIPTPGAAGVHAVDVDVVDANGHAAHGSLSLEVVAPQPQASMGTLGVEPEGSPITDALTVFVLGENNQPRANVGVRVRKNGAEYTPAREALTDAQGRVYFTGLGLDGAMDTVDITANGSNLFNVTMAQVNASRVTLVAANYPLPLRRASSAATWDTTAARFIHMGGRNNTPGMPNGCLNDTVALGTPATPAWEEWTPPGMTGTAAPAARVASAFQFKGSGVSVLFGGESCTGTKLSDTWQFSSATRTWQQSGAPGPSARSGAAIAPSPVAGGILLFGGTTATGAQNTLTVNNELWTFVAGWGKLTPTGTLPTARAFAAAAVDTSTNLMWMCGGASGTPFGGADQTTCSTYNRTTNAWAGAPAMPLGRRGHGMAYRPGDGLYVFGGTASGTARNDLLRFRMGTWSTVTAQGAVGSPPAGGRNLAYDPGTGNLVLVTPAGEVWTFDGAAWAQRSSATAGTVTLSGTLSGGAATGSAAVWVVGTNGFSLTTNFVSMPGGTATYSLAGLPTGVPLSVYAYHLSGGGLYSHKDMGSVGPLSGDTPLDIAFEPGPLTTTTSTGDAAFPLDWSGTSNGLITRAVRTQPGFPVQPIGEAQSQAGTATAFSTQYIAPLAPAAEALQAEADNTSPALCETLSAWNYAPTAGSVGVLALPDGVRGLSPGVSECDTAPAPTALEGSYQYTAPAGTELVSVLRGARGMTWDWKYVGPSRAGVRTFAFPLPSTLAPSRPSPSGQATAYEVTAYVFAPGSGFQYPRFESATLRPSGTARARARGFVRQ
ncbi:putative Ig domain-containing protein [Corallococcus sp. M34]|uniref:Kelch repeat-containing protein n=1 Tax=Citreicoccus inhibens TaxID=2849499 RepID=UPI001C215237|nr:putative Ig domain-containing protein [Citreicoccus inhibens]MBU8898290.1 putative Ig domain-containing protein [Citreicoccus inhibens]